MSALALVGMVAPSAAHASAELPAQNVVGIAGGTWKILGCGVPCRTFSDGEDGAYATGSQLGSGKYHLIEQDTTNQSGTARFVRRDGLVLTGTYTATNCNGGACRLLRIRLNGAGDIAGSQLTLTGTLALTQPLNPPIESGSTKYSIAGSVTPVRQIGYAMLDANGGVHTFGGITNYGSARMTSAVGIALTPTHQGYWTVDAAGHVFSFGDAKWKGNATDLLEPGYRVTNIASTATGTGYWIFTTSGRVYPFGNAHFDGDMSNIPQTLNQPVIAASPTPSGGGYHMVAKDGGVFGFGDAHFYGSMANTKLNKPVVGLVANPTNTGYWLVASDGGVFGFGDAKFHGSLAGRHLNRPITTLVPYGTGYLMVGADGGTFNFSTNPTFGNLAGTKLSAPIVSATAVG